MKGPLHDEDYVGNPEPRWPVCLILAKSSSMNTDGRIGRLNSAVAQFKSDVSANTLCARRFEGARVAFNHEVDYVDFCSIAAFEPHELSASGGTRISPAINTALDLLERRKQAYREAGVSYYPPVALLFSDGEFENDTAEELAMVKQRLVSAEESRSLAFFAFGMGDADIEALSLITPPNRPPRHIGDHGILALVSRWPLWSCGCPRLFSSSDSEDRLKLGKVDEYLNKYDY